MPWAPSASADMISDSRHAAWATKSPDAMLDWTVSLMKQPISVEILSAETSSRGNSFNDTAISTSCWLVTKIFTTGRREQMTKFSIERTLARSSFLHSSKPSINIYTLENCSRTARSIGTSSSLSAALVPDLFNATSCLFNTSDITICSRSSLTIVPRMLRDSSELGSEESQ